MSMNKKSVKIIVSIFLVLAVIAVIAFSLQEKKEKDTSTQKNTEITEEPIVAEQEDKTEKASEQNTKALFDAKMKQANTFFLKGDYAASAKAYTEALTIKKDETAYTGLYSAQLALKKYEDAEKAILSAIELNPKSSDYWSWYLVFLSDALKSPRTKLDEVYNKAYNAVLDIKKINIVTQYARVLENRGDYAGAIAEWQKAMTLYPDKKALYQAEIDILKAKLE